ncbi:MAG: hypothetical protein WBG57_09225 [Ornithinimicrobium sp.]
MFAAISLTAMSAAALYSLGRMRQTPSERAGLALIPNMSRGVKTVADTGAGMRPVEHLRG